jgi:benzoate transport
MRRSVTSIIDEAKLRPIHWHVIWISAIGLLFDGFDYQATAYAAPLIKSEWSLDPKTLGGLISAGFFGLFFGSILASYFSDLVGRKKAFACCALAYSIFTGAAAYAPDFDWFVAFRFLTGLGLGGLIPIAVAWMMEVLPASRRAPIAAAVISCFLLGWIVASAAALFVIPTFGWRAFFAIGALPALLGLLLMVWGPESPLWLLANNRRAEALAVLRQIDTAMADGAIDPVDIQPLQKKSNWLGLFSPRRIRATVIIALMYFMIAVVSGGITQWLPTLLIERGISMRNTFAYSLVVSIGPVIGTIVMGLLLDRWERRRTFILFWLGASFFIVLFAFATSPASVMAFGFGLTFCAIATFSCLDIITAELFATEMRASAVGFGMGFSRLGGAFGPILGGYLISAGASYVSFFLVFAIPPLINVVLATLLKFAKPRAQLAA